MQPTLSDTLDEMGACRAAVRFARGKTLEEAWKSCSRPDWIVWLLNKATRLNVKGWPRQKASREAVFRAIEDEWEDFCREYYALKDHVLRKKRLSPTGLRRLNRFFERQTPGYTSNYWGDNSYRELCIRLRRLSVAKPRVSSYSVWSIMNPRSAAKVRRYYSPGPYDELVKKVWRRS